MADSRFFKDDSDTVIKVPFIPLQVNLDILGDDLRLLSPKQRSALATSVVLPDHILVIGDEVWVRSDVVIASGSHGQVRLIQHDKSGVFYAYKLTDEKIDLEHKIVTELGWSNSPLMRRSKPANSPVSSPVASPKVSNLFKSIKQSASKSLKTSNRLSTIKSNPFPQTVRPGEDHGEEMIEMVRESSFFMKYARGESAQDVNSMELDENDQYDNSIYPPVLRLQFLISIIEELDKLHEANFIHRDLGLGNAILDWIGQRVSLIDYGLSAKLQNGIVMDTLKGSSIAYPPEFRDEFRRILTAKEKGLSPAPFAKLEYSVLTDCYEVGILEAAIAQLLEFPDMKRPLTWGDKTFIVDENHPFCKNNLCFPPAVAKEILDVLQSITQKDVNKRAEGWITAKTRLEKIRDTYFAKDKMEVAILDFDEWIKASDRTKDKMMESIQNKGIKEVWFTDTDAKSHTLKQYAEVQHRLYKEYMITVGDKFYTGQVNKARADIMADLDKRPIRSNYHVISPPQPKPKP